MGLSEYVTKYPLTVIFTKNMEASIKTHRYDFPVTRI